jgi:putative ABC transport system permease protein
VRFRRLFGFSTRSTAEIDRDIRDEVAFHLEHRIRELIDDGSSPEAARAEAHRQFGDVAATAASCRRMDTRGEAHMRRRLTVDELRQDLTYGIRMLQRQRGTTAVAFLTIALGIGATSLVFAVVHAALLAPLPYRDADRLAVTRLSLPDYADLRQSVRAFERTGVWASNLYTLDDEQVLGGVVSPSVFTTLGVSAFLGRTVADTDGDSPVVVLGYGLWQRRFGGDPRIVGRTIRLTGTAYTVIGVMPRRFQFPSSAFQLWAGMGFSMTQAAGQAQNRALRIFQAVGRLRPGVSIAEAQSELNVLAARLERVHPDTNAGTSFALVSLRDRQVGDVRVALLVALGAVGCLLLIACANVANLVLARTTTRAQELALRAALGAGRGRIARQLVTESVLLAGGGGILGILLARWGMLILPTVVADHVPRIDEVALSMPVLLVTLVAMAATALVVGLAPVAHLGTSDLEPSLRGGGRNDSLGAGSGRLRSALVVVQVGIAVVVLAGGLLLTHSLLRLLHVDTGVVPEHLLTFNVQLIHEPTAAARATTAARVLEAITALPGVQVAGGATGLAPITAQRGTTFEVEGQPDAAVNDRGAYFIAASPAYFGTLGTPVLAGREFTRGDAAGAPLVVVVSETLARRFFPAGNAVGRRLRLMNPDYPAEWRTIVGVVRDVRYQGLDDGPRPIVYTPFVQTPFLWMYVHVRTTGDPMALVGSLRATLKVVDQRLTLASPRPMSALIAEASADPRFSATVITAFAAVAVLLAAIGLHGVVSFAVVRRTREIAIQLALGASPRAVRWQVVRSALTLAAGGLAVGLVGAIWLGRFVQTLLFEVTPGDPLTLGAVAGILLVVTLVAAAVPAVRATRIDPLQALRES